MLNVGPLELVVVLVVALLVVGPERLPELARTIGKGLREFRKVQDEVRGMVSEGLGADVAELRREMTSTVAEVRKMGSDVTRDLTSARQDLRSATDVKRVFPNRAHRTRRPASAAASAPASTDPTPAAPPGEPEPAPPPPAGDDGT